MHDYTTVISTNKQLIKKNKNKDNNNNKNNSKL